MRATSSIYTNGWEAGDRVRHMRLASGCAWPGHRSLSGLHGTVIKRGFGESWLIRWDDGYESWSTDAVLLPEDCA